MFRRLRVASLLCLTLSCALLLSGCSSAAIGTGGGLFTSFFQKPLYENCNDAVTSLSDVGKVTEIDGVELKLPVDWNLGYKEVGEDYKGINYDGDDAARGIGIFNTNEGAGDDSTYKDFGRWQDTYAVNMRWEYIEYGYQMGVYPAHAAYKGTDSTGTFEVGGTSASCIPSSGAYIIGQKSIPNAGAYQAALAKARIMVYNPETGKACVCGVGLTTVGSNNLNWGGGPLSLLGGITPAVTEVIGAEQNKTVLECYFVDPNTELGECEYSGSGSMKSSGYSRDGNKCDETIVASSIEEMAVGVAFDPNNPDYPGHKMVYRKGADESSPTTDAAIELRKTVVGDEVTDDCGKFVSSVMRACVDQDYPAAGTGIQLKYLKDNPSKYKEIATVTDIPSIEDELAPGDVMIYDGHTYLYVGSEAIKNEFKYIKDDAYSVVGASLTEFGPKIQRLCNDGNSYTIFRFIGTPNPHPAYAAQMSGGVLNDGTLSAKQMRLISKANGADTPYPGPNLCGAWVGDVFENAGIPFTRGNACDVWKRDCHLKDKSKLKPGMIIASNKTPGEMGRFYGHIGIYIGNNMVADSIIGGVRTQSLDEWIRYNESAGGVVKWGWANGNDLSK